MLEILHKNHICTIERLENIEEDKNSSRAGRFFLTLNTDRNYSGISVRFLRVMKEPRFKGDERTGERVESCYNTTALKKKRVKPRFFYSFIFSENRSFISTFSSHHHHSEAEREKCGQTCRALTKQDYAFTLIMLS